MPAKKVKKENLEKSIRVRVPSEVKHIISKASAKTHLSEADILRMVVSTSVLNSSTNGELDLRAFLPEVAKVNGDETAKAGES